MFTKSYKIATWFVITNYVVIVVLLGFAALEFGVLIFSPGAPALWEIVFFSLSGLGFLAGGIYTISLVPQMKAVVHVSEDKIVQEQVDGTSTQIWWREDFRLRHRPVLKRLELISAEGERTIRLDEQLEGYPELLAFVVEKYRERQMRA